ncbi:DUF1294 domain-containing protein [Petroclostridium sp. X23]|uniref:DUF1294 domain-containing protein n=1 Tax=Petroclostridium sp. X23 TaxID=3045146 RepID=UPI0024AD2DAC|nr:DUF1294 domain-containing protein [Petroclostridium sp. X23]WHH60248.1 DUF1294 domain-containing protein [Petroclostridium sp. X23]
MWNNVLVTYYIIINCVAVYLMWADKRKARKKCWRIKEKTLFVTALLGGAVGILAGMRLFKHKTKHLTFTVGIPLILVINGIVIYWILNSW